MPLPTKVVSDFVKATNDNRQRETETTIEGTIEVDGANAYVKLDGSKTSIPIRTGSTTTDIKNGDRVTVMIKNHTATVTGNLSKPSAQKDDLTNVEQQVAELDLATLTVKLNRFEVFVDTLSVGGRNLYLGTRNFEGDQWENIDHWETWDDEEGLGYREYGRYGTAHGICQPINAKAGEVYTFSFYALGNENSNVVVYATNDNVGTSPVNLHIGKIPYSYKRYHFTFEVRSDCIITPRVENISDEGWIQIYGLKLEKGNVPTDWTPAPEDAEQSAEEASKVATNFMEYTAESGLQLGDKTNGEWSGFRSQITSTAFNILSEIGDVVASYGADLIELGKNSVSAVIKLCGGKGQIQYNEDEHYLDIMSDSIRLKGTEMASVQTGYTDKSGVQRNSAVHVSPTDIQISSGINQDGSWSSCEVHVKPDEITVLGSVRDAETDGNYESFVDGVSGIWTYRKWKNGRVELWGKYSVSGKACTTAGTGLGGWYRTDAFSVGAFPFSVYNSKLVANYESNGYGAFLWPTSSTSSTQPPSYYLIRPSSSSSLTGIISIHVVGEWSIPPY